MLSQKSTQFLQNLLLYEMKTREEIRRQEAEEADAIMLEGEGERDWRRDTNNNVSDEEEGEDSTSSSDTSSEDEAEEKEQEEEEVADGY